MKNLLLWDMSARNLDLSTEEKFVTCYGHGEGTSSGELFICTHNLLVINFDECGKVKWTKDLSIIASPDNIPINITYLSLTNSLCVGLANGELITINDNGNICDLAGVCDNGLLAMEWSPDQELLVLVTKDLKTILMSCTYDPICELHLLGEEFGEKEFITVGWGKKETQFHGSEGKHAAKLKSEVSADPDSALDNIIKITWRSDGDLYAIGFLMEGIRRFKVFDREGHLQYTSEKQQGLESNLSWRPSGNIIVTTQKLQDKYVVAFFEKNGLKHGGFTLPDDTKIKVEDITWSADSEILTLQCKNIDANSQFILIYTTSNYHWYLKQTLEFNNKQKISKIIWDNDFDVANNKKLHIILHNGQHYTYNWILNNDHSKGKDSGDDAIVTVIDGKKILVTGFRQTVVPPPMSAFVIELDSNVSSISFVTYDKDEHIDPNTFFVCTADSKMIFYKQTQKFPLQYDAFKTIQLNTFDFPLQFYNWYWLNFKTVVCVKVDSDCNYNIVEYDLQSDKLIQRNIESVPAGVMRIESHPIDSSTVFLQLSNGDMMQYKLGGITDPQDLSFNVPCPKFNVVSIDGGMYYLGLSHKGQFYINDTMVLNNVSSFFIHTHFLLLTTFQHFLLCTELTQFGIDAIKNYSKAEASTVYKRKIERGAKLVIAVPCETRTVFQMPRGNLEAIQPRPLSLKIIGEYLDSMKYYEAFDLMRKQRINLNLIHDHNPEKFNKSVQIFLESIKNNSWLSLFLSDLENTDVTKTMYASSYVDKIDVSTESGNKIKKICDIIRQYLLERSDSNTKILPLLTTYVKKNTVEDLEDALTVIKQLKLTEAGGSKLPVSSDEALKYLLYMVDVNHLFDVALGMYDFDLVLLVANKSQKDPKEYVVMLNEFNEMDEDYRKYSINKHLKRFEKAVHCLANCGPGKHTELKTFVKYHSLYREALELFSPNDEIFKQISDDFGLYLKLKKQFTEAGLIYQRANNVDKAIECFKNAGEWELAINLAQQWPKDQFEELCWDLINTLKEEKRHTEALTILEQFNDKHEEIIRYATEAAHYKTALRLCSKYNKLILKSQQILPALLEDYKNTLHLIESNWSTFIRHRERLSFVRENKSKNLTEVYDSYANKDSDLYSDAGSTLASSSRGSSRSYRSSKNRRKHERKVASLKEGSQYEDVALVMALHTLISTSFDLRLHVKEINIALSCFNNNKEAFILQTSLEKLLKAMKDSLNDIWTNEFILEVINASIAAQNVPEGCSVIPQGIASLEPQIRIAPVIQDVNWKLELIN